MAGTKKITTPKKASQGKSPRGNSAALVDAVAKKLGNGPDDTLNADVYIQRARKAGKTDAAIAKMTKAQLMKL